MKSPELEVLAREWLRDYHSPPVVEPSSTPEPPEAATRLPHRNN